MDNALYFVNKIHSFVKNKNNMEVIKGEKGNKERETNFRLEVECSIGEDDSVSGVRFKVMDDAYKFEGMGDGESKAMMDYRIMSVMNSVFLVLCSSMDKETSGKFKEFRNQHFESISEVEDEIREMSVSSGLVVEKGGLDG